MAISIKSCIHVHSTHANGPFFFRRARPDLPVCIRPPRGATRHSLKCKKNNDGRSLVNSTCGARWAQQAAQHRDIIDVPFASLPPSGVACCRQGLGSLLGFLAGEPVCKDSPDPITADEEELTASWLTSNVFYVRHGRHPTLLVDTTPKRPRWGVEGAILQFALSAVASDRIACVEVLIEFRKSLEEAPSHSLHAPSSRVHWRSPQNLRNLL